MRAGAFAARAGSGPQSNQRGIETERSGAWARRAAAPQSNQRGIETTKVPGVAYVVLPASIEPAWD